MTKPEAPTTVAGGSPLDGGVRPGAEARWYCLSRDGLATLCADEQDARMVARHSDDAYPLGAPYRAVLLGDVAAERERWMSKCAGKRHDGCQYLAHCGSVCNKCGTVA